MWSGVWLLGPPVCNWFQVKFSEVCAAACRRDGMYSADGQPIIKFEHVMACIFSRDDAARFRDGDQVQLLKGWIRWVIPFTGERMTLDWVSLAATGYLAAYDMRVKFSQWADPSHGRSLRSDIMLRLWKKMGNGCHLTRANAHMRNMVGCIMAKKCKRHKNGEFADKKFYYVPVDMSHEVDDDFSSIQRRSDGNIWYLKYEKRPTLEFAAKQMTVGFIDEYSNHEVGAVQIVEVVIAAARQALSDMLSNTTDIADQVALDQVPHSSNFVSPPRDSDTAGLPEPSDKSAAQANKKPCPEIPLAKDPEVNNMLNQIETDIRGDGALPENTNKGDDTLGDFQNFYAKKNAEKKRDEGTAPDASQQDAQDAPQQDAPIDNTVEYCTYKANKGKFRGWHCPCAFMVYSACVVIFCDDCKRAKEAVEQPSSPKRSRRGRGDSAAKGKSKKSSNKKECAHDLYSLVEVRSTKWLARYAPSMKGKPYPTHCSGCKGLL